MLRFLTAGESHGPALTAIVEGLPAGLSVTTQYINEQLARRQGGYGRGGRVMIERDAVQITAGIRAGYTIGSPVCLQVKNKDWENWKEIMSPDTDARLGEKTVINPRPGHADLAGAIKYGHRDLRNVLERSSARETAARVAAGSLARRLLEEVGIRILGFVRSIGGVYLKDEQLSEFNYNYEQLKKAADNSPVMCPVESTGKKMINAIERARENGDTLGGVFEIRACGVPPGLGSYAQWDRKLDGLLAQSVLSIQAVKAVEIGDGMAASGRQGSCVHDEIFYNNVDGYYRKTNNAGGIEGGVSNGETIIVRAFMKPIPTLMKPLQSVDMKIKKAACASVERSDVCAVPAACVVGEAAVAWAIACAFVEKFGGDSMKELKNNYERYLDYIKLL